jgi:adiponectin receptor
LQILLIILTSATLYTSPKFRAWKWRNVRVFLFIAIGWYGAFPMTHMAEKWGRPKANEMFGWNSMFLEGLSYGAGAAIYAVSGFAQREIPIY